MPSFLMPFCFSLYRVCVIGDVVNREMSNNQHLLQEMLVIRQHLPIDNITYNIYTTYLWMQVKTATIQNGHNPNGHNQKKEISRKVRDLGNKRTVDKCFNWNHKRKREQFGGF